MEIFKGAMNEITLSIQGNLQLGAILANDGNAGTSFHQGNQIFATIKPEDIQIVAE